MKRFLTAVSVALMIGGMVPMIAAPAQAVDKSVCAFQSVDRGDWTMRENKMTIKCFAAKMGVSATTAMYVAGRESGYNEWAWNRSSDCRGLYQHMYRYWDDRVRTYDGVLDRYHVTNRTWHNPRANALVAFAMVRAGGWSPWTTA